MKLQEFALRQNLSNNALYKAIRREGYTAKELTDKRRNITSAGLMRPHGEQQRDPPPGSGCSCRGSSAWIRMRYQVISCSQGRG